MTSIDSFIGIPLLVTAILGLVLLLSLFILKLRNKAKPSFMFYLMLAVIVLGAFYSVFTRQYIFFVFASIVSEFFLGIFLLFKTFDNPEKREAKKAAKASQESSHSDQDTVSAALISELEEKHKRTLSVYNEFVNKVSNFFTNDNSMENFLEYCNGVLREKVSADGCIILIEDDYDQVLAVKSFVGSFPPPYKLPDDLPHKPLRVETNLRFAQFQLSGNIFGDIFTEGKPVLIEDSVKDPRVYQNGPEDFLRTGSYIFAPIREEETVVGLIGLAKNPGDAKFTKDDLEKVESLANAISVTMNPLYSFLAYAEKTELNKGGSIASKYQKDLLPQKLPVISKISIGCFSNQAEGVCGDYYDILPSRKDKISFIMSDVAGKGMNSLIVMIMIRAILRLAVNTAQSAATIMTWANRGICGDSSKIDHFASVALVNYNTTTKEAEIATCGNNPVFLFSAADKTIKQVSTPSEPLGVTKETVFENITLKLNSGDILATCTDGLLESLNENGVQYSSSSLSRIIIKNCNASAKEISNKVKDDLKKFCGVAQQYDDQSLLVIKIQ